MGALLELIIRQRSDVVNEPCAFASRHFLLIS